MITASKIYISPVLSFYIDVYFSFFIISLLVISNTSFYSTLIRECNGFNYSITGNDW